MDNGYLSDRIRVLTNQLVVDVLLDVMIGDDLDIRVHNSSTIWSGVPELVLELELL